MLAPCGRGETGPASCSRSSCWAGGQGCGTGYRIRGERVTLDDVGEGLVAVGVALGMGFGLCALQDAGGGFANGGSLFRSEDERERRW